MPSPLSIESDEGIVLDDDGAIRIDGKMPRENAGNLVDGELACLETDVIPADKTPIEHQ